MRGKNLFYNLRKRSNRSKKHDSKLKITRYLTVNANPSEIEIIVIRNFKEKFINLIQSKDIDLWTGYIIRNVHVFNSFGLFYKTDVVFCNKNFQVLEIIRNFNPQKISHYYPECHFIYCFAPGIIKFLNIQKNDILRYK